MKKILFVYLLFSAILTQAQHWDAGLIGGLTGYQGDLNKFASATIKTSGFAGGLFVRKYFNDQFALRGNVVYGDILANDKNATNSDWRPKRGFSFNSSLIEGSVQGEITLWRESKKKTQAEQKKRLLVPYALLGVGMVITNPVTNFNLDEKGMNPVVSAEAIRLDKDAKFSKTHVVIPVGGGIRFNATDRFSMGFEVAVRPTFSDYLDGISQAANPKYNDWYATGVFNLGFTLGRPDQDRDGVPDKEDKCPTVPGLLKTKGCPDADGDGVSDLSDRCPNVAGKKTARGCPDADADGITDADDQCPDVYGLEELNGCPDADHDNVADKDDKCPDEYGVKEEDGCPFRDRDKDGIADSKDVCPDLKGWAKFGGCPDTDSDGVSDDKDSCPTQPGTVEFKGCPDTDADGVSDLDDRCPTSAGPASNRGCPLETIPKPISSNTPNAYYGADGKPYYGFVKKVYFNTGKSILTGENIKIMDEIVVYLNENPDYNAKINGHTDNTGGKPANLSLSEYRAKSCVDYLIQKGIAPNRMSFAGYASDYPEGDNDTADGREVNRRVEFMVFKR